MTVSGSCFLSGTGHFVNVCQKCITCPCFILCEVARMLFVTIYTFRLCFDFWHSLENWFPPHLTHSGVKLSLWPKF